MLQTLVYLREMNVLVWNSSNATLKSIMEFNGSRIKGRTSSPTFLLTYRRCATQTDRLIGSTTVCFQFPLCCQNKPAATSQTVNLIFQLNLRSARKLNEINKYIDGFKISPASALRMEVRRESCDTTSFLLIGGGPRSRAAEMRVLLRQRQPGCLLRAAFTLLPSPSPPPLAHVMRPENTRQTKQPPHSRERARLNANKYLQRVNNPPLMIH